MLKASSPGIVLTRLAHQNSQAVARPCLLRYIQARPSKFSSRFAVQLGSVPSQDLVPQEPGETQPGTANVVLGTSMTIPLGPGGAEVDMAKGAGGRVEGFMGNYGQQKARTTAPHREAEPLGTHHPQIPPQNTFKDSRARAEETRVNGDLKNIQDRGQAQDDVPGPSTGSQVTEEEREVRRLRGIVLNTKNDMDETWNAYQQLLAIEADQGGFHEEKLNKSTYDRFLGIFLLKVLSRRLIAERKANRKNSRESFLRLLSVYARLRRERERVNGVPFLRTPEWNALIHFAGTGLRGKSSLEAYNAALDVFDDMLRGVNEAKSAGAVSLLQYIEPDIITHSTLLDIALRSEHQPAIDHATKQLNASTFKPTRVTRLSTLRQCYRQDGLAGVREALSVLDPEDVGEDGITSFLNCAGIDGDLAAIRNIYSALREHFRKNDDGTFSPLRSSQRRKTREARLKTGRDRNFHLVEGIKFPRSLIPSEGIYHVVIQHFAYHGYLSDALRVFTEMLVTHRRPPQQGFFQPTYPILRAMFLGFARHGSKLNASKHDLVQQQIEWSWEHFQVFLDALLDSYETMQPSERMVFWIMKTMQRMGGDKQLLQEVWEKLNDRWNIRKGGRLKDLDIRYGKPERSQVNGQTEVVSCNDNMELTSNTP